MTLKHFKNFVRSTMYRKSRLRLKIANSWN